MIPFRPNRRDFLAASSTAGLLAKGLADDSRGKEKSKQKNQVFQESPVMPEPKILLPTDGVPREGKPKRIAAITTAYFKYSHADDIITKFIEGYGIIGRVHKPHCQVVSLSIEQFPETDIGKGMAARYKIPLFKTAAETLTLGGKDLAVDGVLLVGEHGEYPRNDRGQILYPRRQLFEEIVKVFRATGKSVPVYNDKHFSYSWENARWMYDQSKELGFPMMAGSSVPVTWRLPPLEVKREAKMESAVAIGAGDAETIGFHVLESMQAFAERRQGGETGVKAVQCLDGDKARQEFKNNPQVRQLLEAARQRVPQGKGMLADAKGTLFIVDYVDGFRGAGFVAEHSGDEFAIAVKAAGTPEPASTYFYLPKPQRDHFSFLCNHIEMMFLTGKPSYPVERTLLATGMLVAGMDSRFQGGKRLETLELEKVRYQTAS